MASSASPSPARRRKQKKQQEGEPREGELREGEEKPQKPQKPQHEEGQRQQHEEEQRQQLPHQQKPPPPETPAEARRRRLIVLSFWLVVAVAGLPFWWATTSIYRANLPLDRMLQWADGRACRPVFPLEIAVDAAALADHEARHLVRLTQHALDDLDDGLAGHHLRLRLAPPRDPAAAASAPDPDPDPDAALTIRLAPGQATAAALDPHQPVLAVSFPPGAVPAPSAGSSALASFIAAELRSTFAEERSVISYLLSSSAAASASASASSAAASLSPGARPPPPPPPPPPPLPHADAADALAKQTTKTLRYAPTYHLTLSLFTDGATPNTWDIDGAVDAYMRPLLDVLRPMHNFTMDTQVQLYAAPGVQAPVLAKDDLASFINAAEWPLSPSIGGAPTVNFVVFVGNQTIAVGGETSQSWMIPQWGSVYLLAPPPGTHVSREALRQPMLAFGGHLLALLGTPRRGSLPLRLAALSRIRSTDLLLRASSSLGSLARLARALPSISIPRSVADGVTTTLLHLDRACAELGAPGALRHARVADNEAERAFFEKSMVGQLYFPDEHKIAVYLPLLGPVGVPLVLGLVNELRAWRARRRQRAADARDKKSQ